MAYPYRVALTDEQRAQLRDLVGRRRPGPDADPRPHPAQGRPRRGRARLVRRRHRRGARRQPQHRAARAPPVRREGLAATLERKRPDRVYERGARRRREAHLVALACSAPPDGPARGGACACWPTSWCGWRWWRRSPTRRCARRSKKRPQAVAEGAVVPGARRPTPTFVWHMEDVSPSTSGPRSGPPRRLPGRDQPPTARRRPPAAAPSPGRPARHDPEYVRGGVANLFLVTRAAARLARRLGQRPADAASTSPQCVRDLVDVHYPERGADRAGHGSAQHPLPGLALRGVPAAEAKRLADRLEIHHTPKHGSWLNMAETRTRVSSAPMPARNACPTARRWSARSPPGPRAATPPPPPSTGSSPPPTRAPNSTASTRHLSLTHH